MAQAMSYGESPLAGGQAGTDVLVKSARKI